MNPEAGSSPFNIAAKPAPNSMEADALIIAQAHRRH